MKINSYFDNLKQIVFNELSKAKSSVYIAVAWINFNEYYSIFNELIKKGIVLNIICSDNHQNRAHIKIIDELKSKGAKIKLLEMPQVKNHMHHKFAIIDKKTTLNGSFNWSPNATKSFENILVIEDEKVVASKFIYEFKKLELIDTETIKKLINLKKCPYCESGRIVNILVLSSKVSEYFETSGDIVEVCTECDYYLNDNKIITNNQLYLLVDHLSSVDCEDEFNDINESIYDELNQYINNDIIIHAIGQVYHRLNYYDEDEFCTKTLWVNKFVADKIQDEYEDQDFDVNYDSISYL